MPNLFFYKHCSLQTTQTKNFKCDYVYPQNIVTMRDENEKC